MPKIAFFWLTPQPQVYKKTALHQSRAVQIVLAAETANLAENLPDGAATGVAVGVTREEEHLADLLFRICLAKTKTL